MNPILPMVNHRVEGLLSRSTAPHASKITCRLLTFSRLDDHHCNFRMLKSYRALLEGSNGPSAVTSL